jgi:hypothetical protein
MLIFEFFPAAVMIVGLAAGVWLWVLDRRAGPRRGAPSDAPEGEPEGSPLRKG